MNAMRRRVGLAAGNGQSTEALIDALVDDFATAPAVSPRRTLAFFIGAGALVSTAVMLAALGPRHDFSTAVASFHFWVKLLYPLGLAVAGVLAVDRLGRPGATAGRGLVTGAAVVAVMVLLAAVQLADAPHGQTRALLLGHTLDHCTALIVLLSLPILAGGMYAMRRMAPTRLRVAGAAIGVMAGGLSAFIYAVACDETALPFVALWYGSGIAAAALVGALAGPRLLRW